MTSPYATLGMPPQEVVTETLLGGDLVLRSPIPLGAYADRIGDRLRHWALQAPDRVFLAERDSSGAWETTTYREAFARVEGLAQGLLDLGADPRDPLVILSGNSIRHGLLALAAMHIGVPVAPVSPAYSLLSKDHAKLKSIVESTGPRFVYVELTEPFAAALDAFDPTGIRIISREGRGTINIDELSATQVTELVADRFAGTGPDTITKILFTSGSTGAPKGVINTQRMMCSNQKALQIIWPFVTTEPPILVDWLPWNHTFGGNHNFNLALYNGGALYLDEGKPRPGPLFDATVTNLSSVSPTIYFNVPLGMELVIDQLERSTTFRRRFFAELRLILCAGAALPQSLRERLQAAAIAETGSEVPVVSSWGSTETAPLSTSTFFPTDAANPLGLPVPGVQVRLARRGERYELRVKGPNVTPGYHADEEMTAAAFDRDGFYRMGDAGRLANPDDPAAGLVFDGRLSEEFKLSSGTWVRPGVLRLDVVGACSPLVQDAIVTAPNRADVGLLLIPNLSGCRDLVSNDLGPDARTEEVLASPQLRNEIARRLDRYNQGKPSSQRVTRAVFLADPLSIDRDEITDKGYINQAGVRSSRRDDIDALYAGSADVIYPDRAWA